MHEKEPLPMGICDCCGAWVRAEEIDFGIGPYEFWGARGVHHDWHIASPCCEAQMVEGGSTIVRISTHVARRDHKDGKIKAGDRYVIKVFHNWRDNGPGWFCTEKRKLT